MIQGKPLLMWRGFLFNPKAKIMSDLRKRVRQAINESDSQWKATKVWPVKTETDLGGNTVMRIEVSVKKRPKKK